jgi:hypothetical protein
MVNAINIWIYWYLFSIAILIILPKVKKQECLPYYGIYEKRISEIPKSEKYSENKVFQTILLNHEIRDILSRLDFWSCWQKEKC